MLYRTMRIFKFLEVKDCMTVYGDSKSCFLDF